MHKFNSNAAPMTDFDILQKPKIKEYLDHNNYHISKTGHKIDDYNNKI